MATAVLSSFPHSESESVHAPDSPVSSSSPSDDSSQAVALCSSDEEIDLLAQRASTSPSSYLTLLSLLRPRLFSSSALSAQSPDADPATLSLEHRRVQEHFSKLKLSFLHLEAKQKFLAWMASDAAVPAVGPEEEAEAERAIREGKRDIAAIKQRIEDKKANVSALIDEVVALWAAIDRDAAALRSWPDDDWAELRALLADLGETDPSLLCSQAHLDALLSSHRATSAELSAALSSAQSTERRQAGELTAVTAEVERFEAEESALLAQCAEGAHWEERAQWWDALLATHSRLLGVSLRRREGSERSLLVSVRRCGPHGDAEGVEMEVDCVPGSTHQFNGARLVSGDFDAALWDEAVDYALEAQDLGWLIREVQAQLTH